VNKKVLVTVVILVLLYPAAAWVMGRVIESRSSAALTEMTDKAPYLTLPTTSTPRLVHLRAGSDDLAVRRPDGRPGTPDGQQRTGAGQRYSVTLHSVIHHGPICGWSCFALAHVESHLVLSNEAKAAVTLIYGSAEPLTISSRMGFFWRWHDALHQPRAQRHCATRRGELSSDGFRIRSNTPAITMPTRLRGTAHLLVDGSDGSA